MALEFKLERREPRRAAVIRMKMAQPEIGEKIGPPFGEVFGWLAKNGLPPAGPPFLRLMTLGSPEMDVEVGCPFSGEASGEGRLQVTELPGGEVATTVASGPYSDLPQAHMELAAWIAQQWRTIRGAPWESYLNDPSTEPDPAKWLTEICYPV